MSIAIDTNAINIPKRKESSEIVLSIEFTNRQKNLIERVVSYTIRSNAPKLFATTVDNNSFWSIRSTAFYRSMNEMTNGWRNFFKMDIDTAQSLADAVTDFSNENLGDIRGERMIATRIVNVINETIQYEIDNAERNYLNTVMNIKNQAAQEIKPIDYKIEYTAQQSEFRLVAKKDGDTWGNIAQAYIMTKNIVDDCGEMQVVFVVNENGWFSQGGEEYNSLHEAKAHAEYLIEGQITKLENSEHDAIFEARLVAEAMGIVAA